MGRLSDGFNMREGVLTIADGSRPAIEIVLKLVSRPYREQTPGFGWLKILDDLGIYGLELVDLYVGEAKEDIDKLIQILERRRA